MSPDLPAEPRERIVAAAVAIHGSLAAWPWAAEVLTTDGFLGRLGESALRMVEAVVAGAVDHGCTPEQAVHVFRAIWYYTVGEILVRTHSEGRRPAGDGRPALAARDTYREALRAFVDGLLAQATTATTP